MDIWKILFTMEIGLLVVSILSMVNFCYNIYHYKLFFFVFFTTVIAFSTCIVCISLYLPLLLHFISPIVFITFVFLYFYSNPKFGNQQKIPFGSLSLSKSIKALHDEHFYQKRAAVYGSIFKYSQYYKPVICVVGLTDGIKLLKEYRQYLNSSPLPFSQVIPCGFLRFMEKEDHQIYSSIFCKAFSHQLINENRDYFKEQITKEITMISNQKQSIDPKIHIQRIIFCCFSQLIFGIKVGDEKFTKLENILKSMPFDYMTYPQKTKTTHLLQQIYDLLEAQFSTQNSNSVVSNLCSMDLSHANMKTVFGNLIFTFLISLSNATGLLYWVVKELSDHPQWLIEISNLPEKHSRRTELADNIVSEVLRLHQSEYIYRTIKNDFYFNGYKFPKNWLLRICIRESHRDPKIFENPNLFSPKRFENKKWKQSQFSPFGLDHHACFGAYLSKTLAKILICELSAKGAWKKYGDYGSRKKWRHWNHWEPNPDFRISWHNADIS